MNSNLINQFGTSVIQEDLKNHSDGNYALSPLSLWICLSMAAIGAKSSTLTELSKVLEMGDARNIPQAISDKMTLYEGDGNGTLRFTIVNALAVADGLEIKPDFKSAVPKAIIFDTKEAANPESINRWVSERTKGQITSLLDPSKPLEALTLINVIYFLGKWQIPFKKPLTHRAPFFKSPTSSDICDMMNAKGEFSYYQDQDVQVVRLPYQSDSSLKLSALVVLPSEHDRISLTNQSYGMQNVANYWNKLSVNSVDLKLPRFTVKGSNSLKKALVPLGMVSPFIGSGEDKADFTGISDDQLYISEVLQKVVIKVDEDGTEASAATAVLMSRSMFMASVEMNVNRPFLFYIVEESTFDIVFLAAVKQVQ